MRLSTTSGLDLDFDLSNVPADMVLSRSGMKANRSLSCSLSENETDAAHQILDELQAVDPLRLSALEALTH